MNIRQFRTNLRDKKPSDSDSPEQHGLKDQSLRRIAGKVARMGGWAIDLETDTLYWSDEVCEIHDLPPGYQPTLEEGLSMFPEKVRAQISRHMQACREHGTPYDLELPKHTATGRLIWVRSIGEAVRDTEGRIVALQGAFQDISSRKQDELQILQQSAILDQASEAIIATDAEWRITYWNRAAENLYGWSADEAEGRVLHQLLQVESLKLAGHKRQLFRDGVWKGDIQKSTRQGEKLTIQVSWTLIRDQLGEPVSIFSIDHDVTAQRKLEADARQAQKLEAVGTLAGGIAHDFNNLLMVVGSYSERLQMDRTLNEDQQQAASVISQACDRAVTLTKQLLGFSQKSMQRLQQVDLNSLVVEMASLLDEQVGRRINITTRLAASLYQVRLDPEQMKQVLRNLADNALQAMHNGGTLTLLTDNVRVGEDEFPQFPQAVAGDYVMLSVRDTGKGMTPEIMERIFEPFFTTMEVGKGSGLGLSMAIGVMQQSGGWIDVSSEYGKGSCFRIYCPVSESQQ